MENISQHTINKNKFQWNNIRVIPLKFMNIENHNYIYMTMKKIFAIIGILIFHINALRGQIVVGKKVALEVYPQIGIATYSWKEESPPSVTPQLSSKEEATLKTIGIRIENKANTRLRLGLSLNYLFGKTNFSGSEIQFQMGNSTIANLKGDGSYSGWNNQFSIGYEVGTNKKIKLIPQIGLNSRTWKRALPTTENPLIVVNQRDYSLFQYQLGFQAKIDAGKVSKFSLSVMLNNPILLSSQIYKVESVDNGQEIYKLRVAEFIAQPFIKTSTQIDEASKVFDIWREGMISNRSKTVFNEDKRNINIKLNYQYKRFQTEVYYESLNFNRGDLYGYPPVNGYIAGLNLGLKI